ncbi:hypothetical protein SAMN04487764_1491 [Gillisia sp. Hel1_33_143]|uniref:hypothetical protein n=1 Tax=Gillisia sp. Hel1_33_143 TaxID=1336796 RepID=UPI00087A0E21|nr:hypothetical protein [Gillisia sp. Hel1_33_143]SDS11578.1 hypothetical protein SAMN04487764_1491 [Gillisia sp. Hel1_33_143]
MTADEIKSKEKQIGRTAAKMAQAYLHSVLEQKLNLRGKGTNGKKPLLKSTRIKEKMGDYKLLGLNLQSTKTGYILNYGFTGQRSATSVYLKADRYEKTRTQRKRHSFNLPAREIFSDIYIKSGAVDYLTTELSKTRGQSVEVLLEQMIIKFNSTDGK